jgi:competence protein ComEC
VLLIVPEPVEAAAATLDALRRGDRVRVWCRLRRPRPPGNPGESDPRLTLLARGLDAVGSVKSAGLVKIVSRGAPTPARALDALKVLARARLRSGLGGDGTAAAVVGAMMLGDQGALESDDWLLLRDSGLVHLLSISGLHVGLAASLLLAALRRAPLGRWGAAAAAGGALAGLAVLVGAQPPVLRSVLTALFGLGGRALGRDSDPLNALALAAIGLAAARPAYLFDPSFQLTFAATAGILALAPRIAAHLPAPRAVALPMAVSVAAYLATAPVTAWQFGRLAPAALLSNIAAAGLCAGVLLGGTGTLLFAGVPLAGEAAAWLARASVDATFAIASAASGAPAAAFRVPPPPAILAVCYAILLVAVSRERPRGVRGRGGRRLARLALALALVFLHTGPPPPRPPPALRVTVIDVGQGQSVLLQGASGGTVLVDAGGTSGGRFDAGERIVAPVLSRLMIRRIDMLVLTHEHDDHAGGAGAILREFEVGALWIPASLPRVSPLRALVTEAVSRGTAWVTASRGLRATRGGLSLEVLHPTAERATGRPNERSLVLRVGQRPARLLIPADAESPDEEALLASGADLSAEALIVAHHGSRSGTTPAFLRAVKPRVAVVSAGLANRFGHPDRGVVTRLRKRGIPVYRTDRDGQVRLFASGQGFAAEITRRSERE